VVPLTSTFTSTVTMPRMSGRAQVLQDIDTEVEAIAYAYALASSSEEEEEYEEDLEDLRYLLPRSSAGKHPRDLYSKIP